MAFKNSLHNILNRRSRSNPESTSSQPVDTESGSPWDELATLSQDQAKISFDDLSEVPFTGDTSATESSVAQTTLAPDEKPSERAEVETSSEIEAFREFFQIDQHIKSELINLAPSELDNFDESSRIEYADRAFKAFCNFEPDFARITADFALGSPVEEQLANFFEQGRANFEIGRYTPGITDEIYRQNFANLRPSFVEEVKEKCVGYTLSNDEAFPSLIAESSSINELLHAYHSHIMNNDRFLQAIPTLSQKENAHGASIVLRGDPSVLSRQIFDAIPDELDIGQTDIITADENIMMMVRDRGHALTLNATSEPGRPGEIWVEYNIPKICNAKMIEALPGLSGYTDNGAKGGFFVSEAEIGSRIADFIAQVPTDDDMIWEWSVPLAPPS